MPHAVSESEEDYDDSECSDFTGEWPEPEPQELGAIFLNFYQFLTTICFDAEDLKVPPPGGWPGMTHEWSSHRKSDLALEVLRHLPYFDGRGSKLCYVHYNARLVDYSAFNADDFDITDDMVKFSGVHTIEGYPTDLSDVIMLSMGEGSGSRELFLCAKDGGISESLRLADLLSAVDAKEYLDDLEKLYRNLDLIPSSRKDHIGG